MTGYPRISVWALIRDFGCHGYFCRRPSEIKVTTHRVGLIDQIIGASYTFENTAFPKGSSCR